LRRRSGTALGRGERKVAAEAEASMSFSADHDKSCHRRYDHARVQAKMSHSQNRRMAGERAKEGLRAGGRSQRPEPEAGARGQGEWRSTTSVGSLCFRAAQWDA
jgi:hypothetical protein